VKFPPSLGSRDSQCSWPINRLYSASGAP
jgi:hypothetical protein